MNFVSTPGTSGFDRLDQAYVVSEDQLHPLRRGHSDLATCTPDRWPGWNVGAAQ
jgi:hypothetical protein